MLSSRAHLSAFRAVAVSNLLLQASAPEGRRKKPRKACCGFPPSLGRSDVPFGRAERWPRAVPATAMRRLGPKPVEGGEGDTAREATSPALTLHSASALPAARGLSDGSVWDPIASLTATLYPLSLWGS